MSLTTEYLLFIFAASCGILQLAAARAQLRGLLFFKGKIAAHVLATLTIGGAFGWFFGWDNRLEEKILRCGLEGAQQFYYFFLGTLAALIFTLVVASAVNRRGSAELKQEQGLDILRKRNYFEAIKYSFRVNKRENDLHSCRR